MNGTRTDDSHRLSLIIIISMIHNVFCWSVFVGEEERGTGNHKKREREREEMFRVTKKKPRNKRVIRQVVEEEEEEEETTPTSIILQKAKKRKHNKSTKGGGFVVRSFDVDGDDDKEDDDDTKDRSSKRKRKKGLGFGGSIAEDDEIQQEEVNGTSYGKDELERLKMEQKRRKPKEQTKQIQKETEEKEIIQPLQTTTTTTAEDFISLNDNELIPMETDETTTKIETIHHDMDENVEESNDAWQDQIARRAGVQTQSNTSTTTTSTRRIHVDVPSLQKLKEQLRSTVSNLQTLQGDLDSSIMRRLADLEQTKSDKIRYEQSLKETGTACDYYQTLRNTITIWVGAFRELDKRLQPILEALTQLILEKLERTKVDWINYQNDVVSILRQQDMLKQVIGRQPPLPPIDATTSITVDEFGRDVQSQFLRDREKRCRTRMEALTANSDKNAFVTFLSTQEHSNKEEMLQRYSVLQQALRVAMEELESDYVSMLNLLEIFQKWKMAYPDEYRQCYAALSLGDLASILIKMEFCRSFVLSSLIDNNTNKDDASLNVMIQQIEQVEENKEDNNEEQEGPLSRVMERVYVPLIVTVLKQTPSACFLSTETSQSVSKMVERAMSNLQKKDDVEKLQETIMVAIQETLDSIAIPLLKRDENTLKETNETLLHATQFAQHGQALFIQGVILNLLRHWLAHLKSSSKRDESIQCILDFLSSKFLFLLSSMNTEVASDLFAPIWQILNMEEVYREALQSPSFIIQGAPIRAAAMAYGLS